MSLPALGATKSQLGTIVFPLLRLEVDRRLGCHLLQELVRAVVGRILPVAELLLFVFSALGRVNRRHD